MFTSSDHLFLTPIFRKLSITHLQTSYRSQAQSSENLPSVLGDPAITVSGWVRMEEALVLIKYFFLSITFTSLFRGISTSLLKTCTWIKNFCSVISKLSKWSLHLSGLCFEPQTSQFSCTTIKLVLLRANV